MKNVAIENGQGDLKAETESEIVAAQDQALNTKYYATNYYTQRRIANADCANNIMRQETI